MQEIILEMIYFERGLSKSLKTAKEGKKLQKFEYLDKEKSHLDEIKNIFHSF